jgi:hypothetical protein
MIIKKQQNRYPILKIITIKDRVVRGIGQEQTEQYQLSSCNLLVGSHFSSGKMLYRVSGGLSNREDITHPVVLNPDCASASTWWV